MNTEKLDYLLQRIEGYIENHEVLKLDISKASVGWHLDHSLKVVNAVVKTLQESDPTTYKNNFSFVGKVFFALGFFPRGKAKAPKHVKPPEVVLKEDIILQLEIAKTNIKTISSLDNNAYFKHPLFRHINKKRVVRFLVLHTNHHVKIINEITS
ncbi:DUF1569 domain-containing protein [Tenacibaculum todarodis]|uniref:DUF1569 domain-containing protein n=1 Tax=Tenacibaculum todarodis TaxID=1850252 RepID=A0A1L3JMA7_9FLAO|nr:DUF1569 domain-containing protein [Tenacibaculum todarodis]APG66214.1 DUF1569 domain-containing protein [Tenacibaculum todarodis]